MCQCFHIHTRLAIHTLYICICNCICIYIYMFSMVLVGHGVFPMSVERFLKGNKSVPILRHSLCADYVEHCREALKTYGSLVIGKLATSGHLHMWIRSLKEAEAGIFRVWVSFRLLDSVLRTQCRSGRNSHQEVSKLLVFLPNRTLPPLLHARLAVARRLGTCWLER